MRMEHWRYTAPLRLKAMLRRRQVERELDEELQFHLERKIEEGIASGLTPERGAIPSDARDGWADTAQRGDEGICSACTG